MWFWDSSESDQGTMDDKSVFDDCFKLSRTQRLYAFGIWHSSLALIQGNIAGFAVLYTLGNVVSLISTGFLVGFKKQVKTMFAPVRWFASVLFLAAMAATLVAAIVVIGVHSFGTVQVTYLMEELSSRKRAEAALAAWSNKQFY
ncbi:10459_t:CDS:2 [Paraglomus brasilianum]|uniref:Protein transport protein SFT2 n=1 Tax=Paraglomus brasilianum TaxID=144538 RepID=A0A9N9FBY0_9GLOM|nr:10459_t:CDS:2 [Paraglomus brasilianum]